jgi:hypothetical protein
MESINSDESVSADISSRKPMKKPRGKSVLDELRQFKQLDESRAAQAAKAQPFRLSEEKSEIIDKQMESDRAYFEEHPHCHAFYRPPTPADAPGNSLIVDDDIHSILVVRHPEDEGMRFRVATDVKVFQHTASGWTREQAMGFWQALMKQQKQMKI